MSRKKYRFDYREMPFCVIGAIAVATMLSLCFAVLHYVSDTIESRFVSHSQLLHVALARASCHCQPANFARQT